LPTLLYAAGLLLAEWAGFRFEFSTDIWQLLSTDLLQHDTLRSLYLLHGQPPLFNVLAALVLKVASLLSLTPAAVAKPIFVVLGWGTACLLHATVRAATGSRGYAVLALVLLLSDPAFWLYQNVFIYALVVALLLTACAWCLDRYLRDGGLRSLAGLALWATTITCVRSLYHPIWTVATVGGAVVLRHALLARIPRARVGRTLAMLAAFLVLLAAWPTKNLLLFGQWTYSTWTAYNLETGRSETRRVMNRYRLYGTVPPEIEAELRAFERRRGLASAPAIDRTVKADSSRNWNHYLMVVENRGIGRLAWETALRDPGATLALASANYRRWSSATYRDSYTDATDGPPNPVYQAYARLHRTVFFFDPERPLDRLIHPRGPPLPGRVEYFTFFGAVLFPALMVATAWRIGRGWRAGRRREAIFLAIVCFWILWNMAIPCLSDAAEASRMRFDVRPLLLLLTACVLPRPWTAAPKRARIKL
jgi:hypothetical protein